MLNKKIFLVIIAVVLVIFFVSGFLWNSEGETQVKQGVLTNVTSDDTTITLSFSDGETIQVEEDDLEETAEMHYYLSGLIGLNITIEYTCYYSLLSSGYEINSVTPEQA